MIGDMKTNATLVRNITAERQKKTHVLFSVEKSVNGWYHTDKFRSCSFHRMFFFKGSMTRVGDTFCT